MRALARNEKAGARPALLFAVQKRRAPPVAQYFADTTGLGALKW